MKTSKTNFRFVAAVLGTTVILPVASAVAHAGVLYSNGFESGDPGAADFYDSTTNIQGPNAGSNITVVPSGGGALGLTPASGSYYAEITNTDNAYGYSCGQSVYTDYGAPNGIAINGPFYESTDYYINTSWAAAGPNTNYEGFWIDTNPNNTDNDPTWGYYLDETNFRIVDTGNGNIGVEFVGLNGIGSTTITSSGWYTFKTTFENDGGGNVLNNMSVTDSLGNVVGSYAADSSLPFADLTGTNYGDWTTVWEDGFANDVLGIDNVEVGTVPEPASFSLLGVGALALLRRRRRA
ncbi:MAG: PEP-CTERM sorting domain-containing protein [Tepidisphaeraceae bacterium]